MSPRELAAATLEQQRRLADDARARRDAATTARAEAEAVAAKAEADHASAVQASSEKRENDKLADAAARAAIRRDHARADLARAVGEHDATSAAVVEGEARVSAAERAHELAQLLEDLADPARDEALFAHGRAIAAAVADIRERLLAVRGILRKDGESVQRARELGAVDVHARDGIAAAAGLASELAERGAAIANGQEPHEMRHAFAVPVAGADPDAIGAVRSVVAAAMGAIDQGLRFSRHGIAYGGAALAARAAAWKGHRNFLGARADVEARDREAAGARADTDRRAHDARIEQSARDGTELAKRARRIATERAQAAAAAQARMGHAVGGDGPIERAIADGEVTLPPGASVPRSTHPAAILHPTRTTAPDLGDEPRV